MGTIFMAKPDGSCKQLVAISYQETMAHEGYVVVSEHSQPKVDATEADDATISDEVIVAHDPIMLKDAAEIMGKTTSTIRRYIRDGKLENIGEKNAPRVCKNQVADLMQSE